MKTMRHNKKGYFPTPPGTCFIMPDLPLANGDYPPGGRNGHPFVVITDGDEYVECVMTVTNRCAAEGKDRNWKLFELENMTEIREPCPPMDPRRIREQSVDVQSLVTVPKKVLYESTDVRICCNEGTALPERQVKRITAAVNAYAADHPDQWLMIDPYDYEDGDQDYSIKDYLPRQRDTKRRLPETPLTDGKAPDGLSL